MNQIFNFHRFQLMLKLDVSEKGRGYLMMAGLLIVLLLLFMFPMVLTKEHSDVYIFLHGLALFMVVIFGSSLYTNQAFSQYGDPSTGISAIMIPASRLEKFLSALILNLIFTIPLMLLFQKLHITLIDHANASFPEGMLKYKPLPEDMLTFFLCLYIMIQGVIFLGSIYFKKLSYIKTAITFFITYMLVTAINLWEANHFTSYPSKLVTFPFSSWRVSYYSLNKNYLIGFPPDYQYVVYAFPVFLLLAMWFIAYIRLKEKQI